MTQEFDPAAFWADSTGQSFCLRVGFMQKLTAPALFLTIVLLSSSAPLVARQGEAALGQISGIASAEGGGALPNSLVQLRDLDTGEVVGTATTSAGGQFVFVVTKPGHFAVEILNPNGTVASISSAITLSVGAMVVNSVAITAPPGAANSAAPGGAGGTNSGNANNSNNDSGNNNNNGNSNNGKTNGNGNGSSFTGTTAGTFAADVFVPSSGYVSSAASDSGANAGTVPSTSTASPSR
jgi:hypothetical protein